MEPDLAAFATPVVWLQRTASPQYGRELYTLEVLARRPAVAERSAPRVSWTGSSGT
jgi:hypothetical protein